MLTDRPSGRQIIVDYTGMSPRPEYYAGRGATTSDLDSRLLELIYCGVKKEFGDEAATNFVQFVYDQVKLAATSFLNNFYTFVANDCKWTPRSHSVADEMDVGPDDGGRLTIGSAAMVNALSGQINRDQTEQISAGFLWRHIKEYTPDPARQPRDCLYGRWS